MTTEDFVVNNDGGGRRHVINVRADYHGGVVELNDDGGGRMHEKTQERLNFYTIVGLNDTNIFQNYFCF